MRLLLLSFSTVLLFWPSVALAADGSKASIFDYIVAFVVGNIIFSLLFGFFKK